MASVGEPGFAAPRYRSRANYSLLLGRISHWRGYGTSATSTIRPWRIPESKLSQARGGFFRLHTSRPCFRTEGTDLILHEKGARQLRLPFRPMPGWAYDRADSGLAIGLMMG